MALTLKTHNPFPRDAKHPSLYSENHHFPPMSVSGANHQQEHRDLGLITQHERFISYATTIVDSSGREETAAPTSSTTTGGPHGQGKREEETRTYYTAFYTQFTNIIMISTLTGGVEAAILSFMRDLLADDPFKTKMWREDLQHPGIPLYSPYSLGLMLGLLAIALNITVAGVAAVNAAIACHFSLHTEIVHKTTMAYRVVFCMLIQFMASGLSGMSLILLSVNFHWPFTIVAAFLFFAGTLVSAYHLITLFGKEWFKKLLRQPLHAISLMMCSAAFAFDISTPSRSSWFTITTFGITIVYHMIAVLYNASSRHDHPKGLAICSAFVISGFWVRCTIVTRLFSRWFSGRWGEANMYVVCVLSGVEGAILFGIGVWDLLNRWYKKHPERDNPIFRRRWFESEDSRPEDQGHTAKSNH